MCHSDNKSRRGKISTPLIIYTAYILSLIHMVT